ncbi:hypothetical protein QUF76_08690 [Desulfobacterales bacterium HSG16]|nr:hypothetical protein [Desulfobacterales bacterium HSG16]
MSTDKPAALPFLLDNLVKVSDSLNYKVKIIDRNLIRVSCGEKSFLAGANSDIGINPINSHFAAEIANDKARSINLLKAEGFRVPEGEHFFLGNKNTYTEKGRSLNDAFAYARTLGFPVFVKPNRSCAAKFAQAVYSKEKLKENIEKIAQIDSIALIQKIINFPEYRLVTIDGEFQYRCRKEIPQITGDGKKTIDEILEEFNANLGKEAVKPDSHFLNHQLRQKNLENHSILKKGEVLPVASIANLWTGGKAVDYSETVSDATKKWLKKISACLNLRVMGIDVFARGSIHDPENLIILEVNHNPGHKVAPPEKVCKMIALVCQKYFV